MNDIKTKYNISVKEIFKRVFKYALKSKFILLFSTIALIIFSLLDIVQPLIIKKVIDDELAGVQTVWVEVDITTSDTVSYDGMNYIKKSKVEGSQGEEFTLRYFEKEYYFIKGALEDKDRINSVENNIVSLESIEGISFTREASKLSNDELYGFYAPSINPLTLLIIYFIIISLVITITRYIQSVTLRAGAMRLTLDMRKSAFEKINRLPISYFSGEPKGKTVTKMIYDSEGIEGLYSVVLSFISAGISLILIYAGFLYLDWRLALLSLLAMPLFYLWMKVYRRIINRYNHRIREMNSRINGKLAEFVTTVDVIQVFNKEEQMAKEYDHLLTDNFNTKIKQLNINNYFGFNLIDLLRRLLTAAIIIYFSYQYFSPSVLVLGTTIFVYIEYLGKIMQPIHEIFWNLNELEEAVVSSSRIFEFLDEKEDFGIGEVTGVKFEGNIEFKDIKFKYDKENYVLKGISFNVPSGTFVGIVGATGSGKSTLINLIERYYDIEEGSIYFDGVNYHEYSKQDIRNNIGLILQDPSIFEGTIKSNITFGVEATDEEVIGILHEIGADRFINDFPHGIHSRVAYMGENLSTGEKQLISFARILLRNPNIVILDEATANIDTETEVMIQKALTVLAEKRTTFVVAHRLSTIQKADIIYVFDDGKIVESGTHDQLYKKVEGVYRAMFDALS